MNNSSGFLAFVVVFILLIAAGVALASYDSITPTVAEAQAGLAIGTTTVVTLEKGAALALQLLIGAVVAGVATAMFAEARLAYRTWKRSARTGRWQGGPNAQWQNQRSPAEPRLTRQDLMFLALAGKYPPNKLVNKSRSSQEIPDDDDLDVTL